MIEMRLRSKRSDDFMDKYKGSRVLPGMVNMLLVGPTRIIKPDGRLLCVYLPGAVKELGQELWADFSSIRAMTHNRGLAAGGKRIKPLGMGTRTKAPTVASSILGSIDMETGAVGGRRSRDEEGNAQTICRLTAFNATEVEKWPRLLPMFKLIAKHLKEHVPDRFAAQAAYAQRTDPAWVIPETPFTTITVNNSYPTGIHTDRGDLDEGFSTLACMRRGDFEGGWITFPQYGVGADMQDGDLLLMDAHDWHGNTPITCADCDEDIRKYGHKCEVNPDNHPERVSIVSYYRTQIAQCSTAEAEELKRRSIRDEHNQKALGLEYAEQ